jgi:HPr kinase/phosphorylase
VIRTLTARDLYDALRDRLKLHWVSGGGSGELAIFVEDLTLRPATVGYLNLVHPNRIQVLGIEEQQYLDSLDGKEQDATIERLFDSTPVAVIVGDGLEIPPGILARGSGSSTALIRSARQSYDLVTYLQYHVSRTLARKTTLHGVFMEMFTMGVLITGGAGSGKSELALELLTRGHRLVADDAPDFTKISPELIDGTCPAVLQDCLEVRGLGVLNVRHMFGDSAVKLNKFLRLIIHLDVPENGEGEGVFDRLKSDSSVQNVLDIEIARITIPVMAGRNLAVMAEAAVRDFMLKAKGYNAASEFIERHSRLMQKQSRDKQE